MQNNDTYLLKLNNWVVFFHFLNIKFMLLERKNTSETKIPEGFELTSTATTIILLRRLQVDELETSSVMLHRFKLNSANLYN